MTTTHMTKMIARRISKGHNAAQSATLLNDLVARHTGSNLAHALVYNGFASEAEAVRITR